MDYYSRRWMRHGLHEAGLEGHQRPDILTQILLVDDNPLQLKVRETVLRNAGFQVCVATTAESALATLRVSQERIGVVVTDHLMPECSGLGLVQQIRASDNWIPVIVLSGLLEAEPQYEGLEVTFRAKPIPPPELIELVQSSLNRAAKRRGAA
jgi:DNA-binding response OmpR family regulator